jgi:hypothetical protein
VVVSLVWFMTLVWFTGMKTTCAFLISREAFDEFVAAWENGALPKEQWTHAAHVAIGACYSVRFRDAAFERIKDGILRHNAAVGTINSETSGYHETVTRLWAMVLARVTEGISDPLEAACVAVEKFGDNRGLHRSYYSFDVFANAAARRNWVPPDLKGPY